MSSCYKRLGLECRSFLNKKKRLEHIVKIYVGIILLNFIAITKSGKLIVLPVHLCLY
jgi:hypothetical protein